MSSNGSRSPPEQGSRRDVLDSLSDVSSTHASRLTASAAATRDAGLDALLIPPGADLRYLVGYDALQLERLTCLVVPAVGEPALVVPRLEQPAAAASGAGDTVRIVSHEETDDAFAMTSTIVTDGLGRPPASVAVGNRMWAEQALRFRALMPQARMTTADAVMAPLRIRKRPDEIDALRRAGQAIDRVHERMGEWLRPGRTEAGVGRDIADAIVAEGHVTVNFVIVGSGPNGASPHHHVSDRVIEPGD